MGWLFVRLVPCFKLSLLSSYDSWVAPSLIRLGSDSECCLIPSYWSYTLEAFRPRGRLYCLLDASIIAITQSYLVLESFSFPPPLWMLQGSTQPSRKVPRSRWSLEVKESQHIARLSLVCATEKSISGSIKFEARNTKKVLKFAIH